LPPRCLFHGLVSLGLRCRGSPEARSILLRVRAWMNKVEKAFTYRLYCPRKLVVKRAINGVFLVLRVTPQSFAWNSQRPLEN